MTYSSPVLIYNAFLMVVCLCRNFLLESSLNPESRKIHPWKTEAEVCVCYGLVVITKGQKHHKH